MNDANYRDDEAALRLEVSRLSPGDQEAYSQLSAVHHVIRNVIANSLLDNRAAYPSADTFFDKVNDKVERRWFEFRHGWVAKRKLN